MAEDNLGKFPLIELSGTSREIGLKHGTLLAERIKKALVFYKGLFKKTDEEILKKAAYFKEIITSFSQDYADEIEGIAEGAGLDPLWIYALNARTEILSLGQECSSLFFKKSALLGQNWDWVEDIKDLPVILKITRNNHTILMMTEPGIIGKIGLNSAGLGVCLNLLECAKKLDGVPVHILLRAMLDSSSIQEAREHINHAQKGTASSILVADDQGNYFNVELAGDEVYEIDCTNDLFVHTNHYLGKDINNESEFASSFARLARAQKLLSTVTDQTINNMKNILRDSTEKLPICRQFVHEPGLGLLGTICTVIMDLAKREMHITKGHPSENEFTTISIQ